MLCAGLLFDFDARESWMLIAGVVAWLGAGWLIGDWSAVLIVVAISAATALVVYFADPNSPGDTGFLLFYLFVGVPYAIFSGVVVGLGVLADRVGA
jgi:hypothetical protein